MCLLLYMVHNYDSMMDYYPRHIYRTVVKSSSSFSYDAPHTVPAYPIYETCLLLSTSSLWVFQPSAHYAQDSHKLLPFRKFINLTHSDTFIHGPFDFSTINNRRRKKKSGHNLSIRLGHSQIPLWSLSQPTSAFSCANILSSR